MSQNEEVFTAEESRELAAKAVNRLIADRRNPHRSGVTSFRMRACGKTRNSLKSLRSVFARALPQLQTLKQVLDQQGKGRGPESFSLVQDSPNFIR